MVFRVVKPRNIGGMMDKVVEYFVPWLSNVFQRYLYSVMLIPPAFSWSVTIDPWREDAPS